MRRLLLALVMVLASVGFSAGVVSAQTAPEFQLGFKALADQIPDIVGTPLENEHFNISNGNSEQHTSKGLMVWRKADNWTAYTNGYMTWINGPNGVQSRLNTDRFDWEHDPVVAPQSAATPASTAAPAPTAPPASNVVTEVTYPPIIINGNRALDSSGRPLVWKNGQPCQDPAQGGTNCYSPPGGVLVYAGGQPFIWAGGTQFSQPSAPAVPTSAPTLLPAPPPAPVPAPAPMNQCSLFSDQHLDIAPSQTYTWQWIARGGQRMVVSITVWGPSNNVAVRLWSAGGTQLQNTQVNGSGTVEMVAPFDAPLHWDVRNSFWNSSVTVQVHAVVCQP